MDEQQRVVEAAVLGAAKAMEATVDSEIGRLQTLQDDDYEALRRARLAEMKGAAEEAAMFRRNGHGTLQHISEKDFFERAKQAPRMVAIFHRQGSSRYTQDLQDHLSRVAERHVETLFAAIDAEKAPFLCTKFAIRVLPSLVLVKDKEIDCVLHGLDQVDPTGKFTTVRLEARLFELGIVTHTHIGDDQ